MNIGSSLGVWLDIILGMPQGSILRPILFNVFINHLLIFINETGIYNLADDTFLYACRKDLDTISNKLELETNSDTVIANPAKFQLIFLSKYKSSIILEYNSKQTILL